MGVQNELQTKKMVIIGCGDDAVKLYVTLRDTGRFSSISIIDPEIDVINELTHQPDIDIIVNASDNPYITNHLRKLNLTHTDIVSSLSAQLLFCNNNPMNLDTNDSSYQNKILESLHEIRRSVYLTKNKEELLKLILSVALQALQADTGSIMLMNRQRRYLSIEMAQGLTKAVISSTKQKLGKGISGKVAQSGRPMLINGKVPKEELDQAEEREDIFSAICCPMLIGTEVVGVININSKNPEHVFEKEDLRYVQQLATFTSDSIKTSREYERSLNASFAFSVVSGIQDILRLNFPLQERLNLIMMKIVNSLQGKLCNLYWFDNEKQHFFVQASSSFDINLFQNDQIRLNDFFAGRVLRTKSPFTFSVKMGTSDFKKWFIAIPIKNGPEISGLLMLYLISDKDNLDKERALTEKVAALLQEELSKKVKLDSTRLQSIQFSALSEVTFDLAGIHNVRQLARVIVVNACLVLEAESCILNLYNSTMESFEVFESFSIHGKSHIDLLQKLDRAIALKAATASDILIIEDLVTEGYVADGTPTRSVITMILKQNNMIMGALSIYDKNASGIFDRSCFSEHDREVFVKYCLQATKALSRFIVVRKCDE